MYWLVLGLFKLLMCLPAHMPGLRQIYYLLEAGVFPKRCPAGRRGYKQRWTGETPATGKSVLLAGRLCEPSEGANVCLSLS